jgi:CHAD domain-containing protein
MAFALTLSDPSLVAGIRRIAVDRIDVALEALRSGEDRDKAVHTARKRLKELRALVRLVGPSMKRAKSEDREFRDIGRLLSGSRDAAVVAAAFDDLVANARTVLDAATNDRVRAHLAPAGGETGTAEAIDRLVAARERAAVWRISGDGFKPAEKGLAATYARAREAARDAFAAAATGGEEADELLHELRKRVKAHAAHLELLTSLWPEVMKRQAKQAKALAERLGDHHDLAVLAARLAEVPGTPPLVALTVKRRAALAAEAEALARPLLAEHPDGLADRLSRTFKSWRRGAEPLAAAA